MKKPDPNEFYIEYLKRGLTAPQNDEEKKKKENPREKIQKELRKRFEKDKEKHYCLK